MTGPNVYRRLPVVKYIFTTVLGGNVIQTPSRKPSMVMSLIIKTPHI